MKIFVCLLLAATSIAAQVSTTVVDGLRTKAVRLIAYTNCTAVPAPGEKIDSAVIVVRGERINAIGKNIAIPKGAEVRDLRGAWVYAGFVEPYLDVRSLAGGSITSAARAGGWDEDEAPGIPAQQGARYWNQAIRPERRATEDLAIRSDAEREWTKRGYGAAAVAVHDGIMRGTAAAVLLREGTAATTVVSDQPYHAMSFRKGSSKTPYPSSQMGSIALIRQALYDAEWYSKAHAAASRGTMSTPPEFNISLQALRTLRDARTPIVVETQDEHDIARWHAIAQEFDLPLLYKGTGMEFRRLAQIAEIKPTLILPLTFPETPDMRDPISAREVPLTDLINWYWAADNARLLDSMGVRFAFTTDGLKDRNALLARVRECVERGLRTDAALAALTTEPARIAGIGDRVGKLERGYYANLVIVSQPLFNAKSELQRVMVAGNETVISQQADLDMRGHWTMTSSLLPGGKSIKVTITGTAESPSVELKRDSTSITSSFALNGKRARLAVSFDTLGGLGTVRSAFIADSILINGDLLASDGRTAPFILRRDSALATPSTSKSAAARSVARRPLPKHQPLGPFGLTSQPTQRNVVLRNATVWTSAAAGVMENTDVAISNGKITGIGKGLFL